MGTEHARRDHHAWKWPVGYATRLAIGSEQHRWCRSDFMLWEVAYAKLHFVRRLWPEFTAGDFQQALISHTGYNESGFAD